MKTPNLPAIRALRPALNTGRIVGQKKPLKPKHVWVIRVRLELAENHRDLALFNLAIDSKLRGCDLMTMSWRQAKSRNARRFCRAKPRNLCASKSLKAHVHRSQGGCASRS
jgi:hypothetical protein